MIATSTRMPRVISRRAWNKWKESNRKTNFKRGSTDSSSDEKPWPRNMQIAGYAAGSLAVPYIVMWTITSNPTLRQWFAPLIPLDKLRTHFGELEPDSRSYGEELDEAKKTNIIQSNRNDNNMYYRFPQEPPLRERLQQEIIDKTAASEIEIELSVSSPLEQRFPQQCLEEVIKRTVSSNMIASSNNLLQFFPSIAGAAANKFISVDACDDSENDSSNVNSLETDDNTVDPSTNEYSFDRRLRYHSPHELLSKTMQTMSKWSYLPPQPEAAATNVSKSYERDIEISRLEYDIDSLEKSLRDPLCTREVDDIQRELSQAKRGLSKLKWKRLFGLS